MPPLTPSSTRAPASGASAAAGPSGPCPPGPGPPESPPGAPRTPPAMARLLDGRGDLGRTLPVQLALAQLLHGHRERLAVGTGVDHGRDELADALTELGVIAVDLPGAPRGQDDQRVLGVDPSQQVVDPRLDHLCSPIHVGGARSAPRPPNVKIHVGGARSAPRPPNVKPCRETAPRCRGSHLGLFIVRRLRSSRMSMTSSAALSSTSLTTVTSNSGSAASSSDALARRRRTCSSVSVLRRRSRRSSSERLGGLMNTMKASGQASRTCRAP